MEQSNTILLPPVACYTCGYKVSRHWLEYVKELEAGNHPGEILDKLGVDETCCRRELLNPGVIARKTHVPVVDGDDVKEAKVEMKDVTSRRTTRTTSEPKERVTTSVRRAPKFASRPAPETSEPQKTAPIRKTMPISSSGKTGRVARD